MESVLQNNVADEENNLKHYKSGSVILKNKLLACLKEDHLYHIAMSNVADNLKEMFGDVKFVCFGGQATRMEKFAKFMSNELGLEMSEPRNYAGNTDRYVVYKSGPVLSVSHGIGIPSLSIIFQEIVKLLHYAGCEDVTFFRIGTSGGIGLEAGTVVVSDRVVNGELQPSYNTTILGKSISRPAVVDRELIEGLVACAQNTDTFKTVKGTTLCADDFYEGQGRIDGAFCDHDNAEKMAWLMSVHEGGVRNMEMESLGFIAMCHRANVRGAVCCVTLLNRLEGDNLTTNRQLMYEWQTYPQILVSRYIQKQININSRQYV